MVVFTLLSGVKSGHKNLIETYAGCSNKILCSVARYTLRNDEYILSKWKSSKVLHQIKDHFCNVIMKQFFCFMIILQKNLAVYDNRYRKSRITTNKRAQQTCEPNPWSGWWWFLYISFTDLTICFHFGLSEEKKHFFVNLLTIRIIDKEPFF